MCKCKNSLQQDRTALVSVFVWLHLRVTSYYKRILLNQLLSLFTFKDTILGKTEITKFVLCVCMSTDVGLFGCTEICRLECNHGTCRNQKCHCHESWSGALCDQLQCDHRCDGVRGYCNNGTCECRKGWNGKHCSLG